MNLLFYAPQMADYGGIERHVVSLIALMAGRGHAVTLITTSNSLGEDLRSELRHPLITLRELPVARRQASRRRKTVWLLREVWRARRQPWDIIYTNGESALSGLLWHAARSRHTRRIHHHHTSADLAEQATWSPLYRRVLRTAPELVACCCATRDAINGALHRTRTLFLPVLARRPMDAGWVADVAPRATLHFGFTGRLIAEKGIAAICRLSADPELADITWHIHGSGPQFPPEYFKAWPRVVYHGAYTGADEQARILHALDALVLFSSHAEGLPLSISEGMSAGLPWIGVDRGGTRELALSPANSIVVPYPASHESLRAAVSELRRRIRAGLTSRVTQRRIYDAHFSPAVVSRLWIDFLERRVPPPVQAAGEIPHSRSLVLDPTAS